MAISTRQIKFALFVWVGALSSARAASPWMDPNLSPDARAALVLKQMTLDEKITLLHGTGMQGLGPVSPLSVGSNGGPGYVVGIPRLGIPALQMADAAYGVRGSGENGRYSTALPANIASAASWDIEAAYAYGALIGRELRAQGYNMTLGGGVNLAREPRNGRTFEYLGEDPLLAGRLVGQVMSGMIAQHVLSDIKHFAVNDQESGRMSVNAVLDERSLRETDLLAFEIGIREGHPSAVMCSYNRLNGDYACENKHLLNDILKGDWGFPGFVVSDWGGLHSTAKASAAGMDHEEPTDYFFGALLKKAVDEGKIPLSEVDDHARRILRSMFAAGVIDDPPQKSVIDVEADLALAQSLAEQSIVLLKNEKSLLPLEAASLKSIAVIGAHADVGMISGGGSAQVDPPGGNAIMPPGKGATTWQAKIWFPSSPLKAIQAQAPHAKVEFNSGSNREEAAALAKKSDIAIVFAWQWECEGRDLETLSLPDKQDALIAAVAAANPRTIVVLETGGPVTMPWVEKVNAVVEVWYAGSRGAQATGRVLFGEVNPSGKLPITFPRSEADLPHAKIAQPTAESNWNKPWEVRALGEPSYSTTYSEGLKVGYKWYDAEGKTPLFAFGDGLSYTSFSYSDLSIDAGSPTRVHFKIANAGSRAGAEIAQVYAGLPKSVREPPKRLVGFSKVRLEAGETRAVSLEIDPQMLSIYDADKQRWTLATGDYVLQVGGSSQRLTLSASFKPR